MDNSLSDFKPHFYQACYSDMLELSDGQLRTYDGHSFSIHKIELAKRSDYFYRLFCGDMGKGKTFYHIPGIKGEVLAAILKFVYAGKVHVTDANLCEILIAADYLLLDDIVEEIKSTYIRDYMTVSNCLPLFLAALQMDRKNIVKESFRYILTHFESVVAAECSHLQLLPLEVLEQVLANKSLCVQSENAVWMAISKWIEADVLLRQRLVPILLKHIAILDVDETLAQTILDHLASNRFCEEIHSIRQRIPPQSNLDVLKNYILKQQNMESATFSSRQPPHLHFIAHYCVQNQRDGVNIYITYDENIDLWRKILEIHECPGYILSAGLDIYIFSKSGQRIMRYNLLEKEWSWVPQFRVPRYNYAVVQLDGFIYIIGGVSVGLEEETNEVEVYSSLEDTWRDVCPMMPLASFAAVTVTGRIYVVGHTPHFLPFDMVAQEYLAEIDSWMFLPSPSVFRFDFALVGYREKLYVIGGRDGEDYLKSVEVFDTGNDEWTTITDLPYSFYFPKAIVVNDTLIVYDNHVEDRNYWETYPAVQWDESRQDWRPYEETSPINIIQKYYFLTPDSQECINRLSRENKDPGTEFVRSPFA